MGQLKKYVASISRCIASTLCVVHVLFVGEEVTSAEARGLLSECHAHALLRARATGGGTSDIEANVGVAHTLVQQQCSRWLSECAATVSSKHEWSLPATTISHLNELSGAIGAKADACLERPVCIRTSCCPSSSSRNVSPVACGVCCGGMRGGCPHAENRSVRQRQIRGSDRLELMPFSPRPQRHAVRRHVAGAVV